MSRVCIHLRQSCSATQAPVMAAVRVPPSAWITSQSTEIWRSPSFGRSTTARSERPIRRWISCVRPEGWPDGRLAARALVGGARQHAVFGRHPAAALALEPGRQALLQARRAVHVRVAELDEAGALGVHRHGALDARRGEARRACVWKDAWRAQMLMVKGLRAHTRARSFAMEARMRLVRDVQLAPNQ